MISKEFAQRIAFVVGVLYPDAHCELDYRNERELLIAILLSAQTTDVAVNQVTPALFAAYPTLAHFRDASLPELEHYLRHLGLFRNKAKNIQAMARMVLDEFNGQIPTDLAKLERLPGVGRKTADVFLAVGHHIPRFAVDTHVERVAKRLGIVEEEATPLQIEHELMTLFPESEWIDLHHRILFFGRYHCTAKKPACKECPLLQHCKKPSL